MYEKSILEQKREIVEMVYNNGIEAHLSPAFAVLEILNVLLNEYVECDNMDGNELILSNGHVALGMYAIFYKLGIIDRDEFYTFSKRNTRLGVHPDRHYTPGTVASTGSLGHGFPIAVGIAYAWLIKKRTDTVYVMVGDGELNEGTIWESAIFAGRMKLSNVVCIVDDNNSTQYMPNIIKKFEAFDWDVTEIDGHSEDAIRDALEKKHGDKPLVIVAKTIKGNGVSMMERNHALWHHKNITKEEYVEIMRELSI